MTPSALPPSVTSIAGASANAVRADADGLVDADERQRFADHARDLVGELGLPREHLVEQLRLVQRADDLAEHHGRLGREHEQLRDPGLGHAVDRLAHACRSGARRRAARCGRPWRASMSAIVCPAGALREAVGAHPLVVEDLAEVAAAAVGQQHDDDVVGAGGCRGLERRDDGHAARPADEDALLAGEAAGHRERLGVGDRDDLVRHRRGRRRSARSPRRRPRRGRGGRCRRSRPSPRGRRR